MVTTHGLAGTGRAEVGPRALAAWEAFLAVAAGADLSRPSGRPGWRGHEVCVRLGLWGEHWDVYDLIASARTDGFGPPADLDAGLLRAHQNASRAEVLAALRQHRDAVALYFTNSNRELDLAPSVSALGRVPLLSMLFGQAYDLAVHALDLVECGAPPPPAALLDTGLAALAELLGALAFEAELAGGAAFHTPTGGWSFAVDENGWTVTRLGPRRPGGTVIAGTADDLLRAAAGRVEPLELLAARKIQAHQLSGLHRLAPLADAPGTPGRSLLQLS